MEDFWSGFVYKKVDEALKRVDLEGITTMPMRSPIQQVRMVQTVQARTQTLVKTEGKTFEDLLLEVLMANDFEPERDVLLTYELTEHPDRFVVRYGIAKGSEFRLEPTDNSF